MAEREFVVDFVLVAAPGRNVRAQPGGIDGMRERRHWPRADYHRWPRLGRRRWSVPPADSAMPYDAAPRPARDDIDSYVDMLEHVVDRGFVIRSSATTVIEGTRHE